MNAIASLPPTLAEQPPAVVSAASRRCPRLHREGWQVHRCITLAGQWEPCRRWGRQWRPWHAAGPQDADLVAMSTLQTLLLKSEMVHSLSVCSLPPCSDRQG